MVLDYRFISESDLIYLLKLQVPEEIRFTLDYQQILNSAKDINGYYLITLPDKTIKVNKITGEVIE